MENTLENKAKFFAQYWGQKVLTRPNSDNKKWVLGDEVSIHSTLSKSGYDYQYFLELKPLSLITDEDKIQIGLTKGYLEENYPYADNNSPEIFFGLSLSDGDYLRSKGYALSWMGLSVETLEEYGWIKFK